MTEHRMTRGEGIPSRAPQSRHRAFGARVRASHPSPQAPKQLSPEPHNMGVARISDSIPLWSLCKYTNSITPKTLLSILTLLSKPARAQDSKPIIDWSQPAQPCQAQVPRFRSIEHRSPKPENPLGCSLTLLTAP